MTQHFAASAAQFGIQHMVNGDDGKLFRFSESVETFYRDKRVRSAVELLIDQKIVFAPEKDDWDQVETFYNACLSARQTQIEFAKDLFRLWTAIWSGFPQEWKPVAADPKDEELSLDPTIRWGSDYFERHFRLQHGKTFTAWVAIGDDDEREMRDVRMCFDVRKGDKSLIKRSSLDAVAKLPGWVFKDDAMRKANTADYVDGLDLSCFRAEAQKVFTFVDNTEW